MDLSLIILNFKSVEFVRQQLRFLFTQAFPFTFEVIVVDNASGDPIDTLKEEYPQITTVMLTRNIGMGAGNNAGIAVSRGEYILILNPDVIIMQGSVEYLIQFLRTHPGVGMVGPKLLNPDGTLQYSCFRFHRMLTPLVRRTKVSFFNFGKKELARFLMLEWNHQSTQNVDWLLGAAMMMRKRALQEVGTFDERFFLFLEETDLCRRFWRQNWEVAYFPTSIMIHYPHRLSSSENIMGLFRTVTWIHVISWFKYLWKWRGKGSVR